MSGQHGQLMSWCRNVAQHGVQVGSWSREQLPGQTGYQLQHSNTINTAVAASYSVDQPHHTTVVVTSLGRRERGTVGVTSALMVCYYVQYVTNVTMSDDKIQDKSTSGWK